MPISDDGGAARETCQIGAARARQELHDGGLVAEGRVVHRAVAVLVLDLHLGGRPQQNPDHLRTQTKQPLRWLKYSLAHINHVMYSQGRQDVKQVWLNVS